MSPSKKWLLGGSAAAALLFVLGFLLVVNPARNQAADLQADVEAMNESNVRLAAKVEQLKQQSAEVPSKLAEIEEVKKKLPSEVKQPELVRSIEQEAQSAGVDLTGITPATPTSLDGTGTQIVVLPMAITAKGRYANVKTFVDNLERQDRAFLINSVAVTTTDSADEFELSLEGDFFSLPEGTLDSPQAAPAPTEPQAAAAAQRPKSVGKDRAKTVQKPSSKSAKTNKSAQHKKADKQAQAKKHMKVKKHADGKKHPRSSR